jgi:hypothetical protein
MIRQDRLEEQLLDTIGQRILDPATLDRLVARCEEELRKRLTEMERQGSIMTVDSLKKELEDRKRRQAKLIEAIETSGDISLLTERLRALGGEVKRIEKAIASYRPIKLDVAVGDIRDHVTRAVLGLKESLLTHGDERGPSQRGPREARRELVLTPGTLDGRPIYKVTGNVSIPDPEKCRMQLVARDGLEPPTPAFSGLRSTN